jgi:two component transcriptional regulator, winged helix family
MPKLNGFEVVKELRNKGNHTSVLMLTARDSADDKVKGLDLGADDYLVKPFDFNELSARIRAVVRRKYGNSSNKLITGDLILDTSEKSVTRAGKKIDLTGKEYEVLEYLVQSKNRILSRDQIKEHVWDYDYEGDSNIIDVLIKNIRKKIDVENGKQIIYTKRGLGYVVKEED